jgi:Lar family restriction alleviation protein
MKTKTLNTPKLRPCPFCGDCNPRIELADQNLFVVVCGACGARIDVSKDRLNRLFFAVAKRYAIQLWNRRVA